MPARYTNVALGHLQLRGKGGLTNEAIQRLIGGARIVFAKHSASNNVSQLVHDLRNGPSRVFGNHSCCSVESCTFCQSDTTLANGDINESQNTPLTSDPANSNIEQQIDTILEDADTTTPEDEHDATHGQHPSLAPCVTPGLLYTVVKCTDRIMSFAPQLNIEQTSYLAESYMSTRCIVVREKQFKCIQSRSFEHQ